MKRDFDVVIAGGGLAGAATAALLANLERTAALRVAVLEPAPVVPPAADEPLDLRVSLLSRASQRLCERTGAWSAITGRGAAACQRMIVWEERGAPDGHGRLCFDAAECGEPDLGHVVENRAMQAALLARALAAGVTLIRTGIESLALAAQGIDLRTADGRRLQAALLIGADGGESAVRRLAGIATTGRDYEQRALVAHLRCEEPHRHTAWQRFLDTGPLALLPLADGRVSLVWSTDTAEALDLVAAGAGEFAARVTAAAASVLGALELTTARASFPLRLQCATRWVAPRVALVGDAAHVVHPLAGQGVNLGLLDCAALVELLDAALAAGDDPGDLRWLRGYERWRRAAAIPLVPALDGIQRLFSGGEATRSWLRRRGLELVDATASGKRLFVRRALGLSGDVPRLLQEPRRG